MHTLPTQPETVSSDFFDLGLRVLPSAKALVRVCIFILAGNPVLYTCVMSHITRVLGDRTYPCCSTRYTKVESVPGTYSRQCSKCGTYWLLVIEPALLADRFPGLLKMRWATKRGDV